MLKLNLNLSEKTKRVLPDRLGSLIAGFETKEEEDVGESGLGLDHLGEELETFHSCGYDLETVSDEEEWDSMIRPIPVKENQSSVVSVAEMISADEKRSELDFEANQMGTESTVDGLAIVLFSEVPLSSSRSCFVMQPELMGTQSIVEEFAVVLSQKHINLEKLQGLSSSGLPDGGGLRATAWKLLLGYLPASRDMWEEELAQNRLKYASLKEEFLLDPSKSTNRNYEELVASELEKKHDLDGLLRRHDISHGDHPLSNRKASIWHQYFQDAEIAEQIDRDLQRTHPDMKFFSGDSSLSRNNRQAMRNILLLFAKLNPAIRYVQGMNEVLAPLYYIFSTNPDEQNATNAEADSFSCFVRLLSDSVDHFCQQLDNSSVGIHSTLSRLAGLLKANDEELWWHLEITNKVNPQFYAFRWITLLLTQEFNFSSIIRIWDSLLSSSFGVQEMLLRVCCAMLLCVKSRLLSGDFTTNLKLLQHYPEININHLLQVAQELTPTSYFSLVPV
ncbi:hypothetical protein GIB67_017792 [Kingdonia uniflora]|uniref:Rab-GAP TBC domain-containing protein n=1 Tax=Kingdonia uniflora TaxID=39325 RepID=A0A7J7MP40_9MAGN|nr:hypothetical protein GIB67_017792 [Kingdonia uniflora]